MKKVSINNRSIIFVFKRIGSFFIGKIIIVFIGFILLGIFEACENTNIDEEIETDPCSVLVNGVYQYPTENPDSTMTPAEIKEYWNIPEDVLGCISTAGLIQSCYSTHNIILITAKDGYQPGYELVKGWNRGFDELESREDATTELINFYKNVPLSDHIDYGLCCLEVAMAQNNILKQLTTDQKEELLNLILNYLPIKKEKYTQGSLIYEGTPIIMGRLMIYDNYSPFLRVVEENEEIKKFMEGIYRFMISFENADTIVNQAENYLEELAGN